MPGRRAMRQQIWRRRRQSIWSSSGRENVWSVCEYVRARKIMCDSVAMCVHSRLTPEYVRRPPTSLDSPYARMPKREWRRVQLGVGVSALPLASRILCFISYIVKYYYFEQAGFIVHGHGVAASRTSGKTAKRRPRGGVPRFSFSVSVEPAHHTRRGAKPRPELYGCRRDLLNTYSFNYSRVRRDTVRKSVPAWPLLSLRRGQHTLRQHVT